MALMISSSLFAEQSRSKIERVEVPAVHSYIPKGYDSNDNIELVAEGYLPNLCYKSPHADVEVKGNRIDVTLKAWSTDNGEMLCAEMIVPFIEVYSVGVLDKGTYFVSVNGGPVRELFVEEATSDAIDENVYANVETIEPLNGSGLVKVKGHNPSSCFEFDRFEVYDNGEDVYSVLPIMEQVSDFCPMKMVPFTYELEVPSTLERERVLLHVRALNGKSVNALYHQRLPRR